MGGRGGEGAGKGVQPPCRGRGGSREARPTRRGRAAAKGCVAPAGAAWRPRLGGGVRGRVSDAGTGAARSVAAHVGVEHARRRLLAWTPLTVGCHGICRGEGTTVHEGRQIHPPARLGRRIHPGWPPPRPHRIGDGTGVCREGTAGSRGERSRDGIRSDKAAGAGWRTLSLRGDETVGANPLDPVSGSAPRVRDGAPARGDAARTGRPPAPAEPDGDPGVGAGARERTPPRLRQHATEYPQRLRRCCCEMITPVFLCISVGWRAVLEKAFQIVSILFFLTSFSRLPSHPGILEPLHCWRCCLYVAMVVGSGAAWSLAEETACARWR